jgi:hypothetical protein
VRAEPFTKQALRFETVSLWTRRRWLYRRCGCVPFWGSITAPDGISHTGNRSDSPSEPVCKADQGGSSRLSITWIIAISTIASLLSGNCS